MTNAIGIVSTNYFNDDFGEITDKRSIASVPFGGRYRLIDFALSNMVNSGITTVGVITSYYYRSLMDHIGSGRCWGLARKSGGMFILPGTVYGVRMPKSRFILKDIKRNVNILTREKTDYVVFADSSVVWNIDYRKIIADHEASGKRVTLICAKCANRDGRWGLFFDDKDGKPGEIRTHASGEGWYFTNSFIIDRKFLLDLLSWYSSLDNMDLTELLIRNESKLDVNKYVFDGYVGMVDSSKDYMRVSMDLLKRDIQKELFGQDRTIITKIQDVPPTIYRSTARVRNSLIAAGCIIEGTVENSIIFRTTRIKPGAVVRNSIIMSRSVIAEGAVISNAICDKYAYIGEKVRVSGTDEEPIIFGKNRKL